MNEKRPNVFPSGDQKRVQPVENIQPVKVDAEYDEKKLEMANEVYSNSLNATGMDAIEQMRKRTEEQMKLRDEALKNNSDQSIQYQEKLKEASRLPVQPEPKIEQPSMELSPSVTQRVELPKQNDYIQQLSQPQFNAAFDVIPLPSEGKIYRNKKSSVRLAYMTTADENILTSPNLLQSGEFLEILINRKLLETDLRYKDLHVGDRNAIMLWLRATSYGEMYPVTMYDENDNPFETEIDLTTLKTKKLGAEPDGEGYFSFQLPVSKNYIKFKLLTVGDLDEIDRLVDIDLENEIPLNNINQYKLERQIVEVAGTRDKTYIKDFVSNMRIRDAKELRAYIDEIESGVELDIEVRTPGGGSVKSFLPLNVKFFWPDVSV